ncbi:uncharacterized protein EAF02_009070 [Botrytis sinoallii]|uniref:uncharacterized protein n=1 Tax=Botrytis sinoallii TaxID=1463999 RepID=UPI0019014B22|nr:uncharacterized protein EAF02_009070 [Botrytis sinoallii]KAF7871965.1 hypothetical protein EAF02_009070 [Botrytis sinoallii]
MTSTSEYLEHGLSTHMANKLPKLAPLGFLSYIAPPDIIRLEQAENRLLIPQLLSICKDALNENLSEDSFLYPTGLGGEAAMRKGFASFFNTYFNPSLKVEEDHISTGSGCASVLDSLMYSICDEGDIVLAFAPVARTFDIFTRLHAPATILTIPSPNFRSIVDSDSVDRLITTYNACPTQSRIKAILICNPHNPGDDTYSPETLRKLMDFCHEKQIHYISDEIGALSAFNTDPEKPFTSALSLVEEGKGIDRSRVHVMWSPSKDFGCAGMRLGCIVSQANKPLLYGISYSNVWQVSTPSSLCITAILTSPQLPALVEANKEGLKVSYDLLTSTLKDWNIDYVPVKAGIMIFVRIVADAKNAQDEMAVLVKLRDAGVLMSPRGGYLGSYGEFGWVRLTFAVKREVMVEALDRMKKVLRPISIV